MGQSNKSKPKQTETKRGSVELEPLNKSKPKQPETERGSVELEPLPRSLRTHYNKIPSVGSFLLRTHSYEIFSVEPSLLRTYFNKILSVGSSSLTTLPNDILLDIFSMLDVQSVEAVLKTYKRFKSIIYGSKIKPAVIINYIPSDSIFLYWEQLHDLVYPLKCRFQNLGLPFSLEFKPVDIEYEIVSSSVYSVNVLLWVEQGLITNRALQSLWKFISKISEDQQTPIILLLKGDSVFFKHEKLLQKVRELSSLIVLGIIDGSPKCWSKLDSFNELELVYFVPQKKYRGDKMSINLAIKTVWTINTYKTKFIIDPSVFTQEVYGNTG
jgi:hypothetical protein